MIGHDQWSDNIHNALYVTSSYKKYGTMYSIVAMINPVKCHFPNALA
jgi:hypothetical protein